MSKDIKPKNDKGQAHGQWKIYWSTGAIQQTGNYVCGKREGYFEVYYNNGKLIYKANFVNDEFKGYSERNEYYKDDEDSKRFYLT